MIKEDKPEIKEIEEQKFINTSGLEFKDISTEQFRTYVYANGFRVKIEHPIKVSIKKNGNHRVWDGESSFWIREGFMIIIWKAKEGLPHFTF